MPQGRIKHSKIVITIPRPFKALYDFTKSLYALYDYTKGLLDDDNVKNNNKNNNSTRSFFHPGIFITLSYGKSEAQHFHAVLSETCDETIRGQSHMFLDLTGNLLQLSLVCAF